MQKTKNYTLTFTREIGRLWILKDIDPFRTNFERFFQEVLGHDIGKLMTCGCTNFVLDILAGGDRKMGIDLRMASERMEMPGYVEYELMETAPLAARYHVNNCPGMPQLQAWVDDSARVLFREFPKFAYFRKI